MAALDRSFEGDEARYRKNLTQPDRNQAWYHVLVHEAGHTTYAAESSLAPDESPEPVNHPLVQRYFKELRDGRHVPRDS